MSALVAAIPILVLFYMLGIRRTPAWMAAGSALGSALVVALAAYGMPVSMALIATIYGAAFGLFPIAWIVFTSIMLYRLAVDTGLERVIFGRLGHWLVGLLPQPALPRPQPVMAAPPDRPDVGSTAIRRPGPLRRRGHLSDREHRACGPGRSVSR